MAVVKAFITAGRLFNIGETGSLRFMADGRKAVCIEGHLLPDDVPAFYFQIIPRTK